MNKSVKRAFALVLPAVLWGCSPPENPQAGVLMVGPGMAFSLPSEAAKAAKPGNVIRIAHSTDFLAPTVSRPVVGAYPGCL